MQYRWRSAWPLTGRPGLAVSGQPVPLLVWRRRWWDSAPHLSPEASRGARMAAGLRPGFAQSVFQVGGNFGSALGPLLAAFIVLRRAGEHSLVLVGGRVGDGRPVKVGTWYKGHLARLLYRGRRGSWPPQPAAHDRLDRDPGRVDVLEGVYGASLGITTRSSSSSASRYRSATRSCCCSSTWPPWRWAPSSVGPWEIGSAASWCCGGACSERCPSPLCSLG